MKEIQKIFMQEFIAVQFIELKEEKRKHLASATSEMMLKHFRGSILSYQLTKVNCYGYSKLKREE